MAGGRPTKYDPQYCDEVIAFMSKGYSFDAFCGHIDIVKDTAHNWVKEYPEFSDAYKRAKQQCRVFWEKQAIEGLWSGPNDQKLNSTTWIFNMKNRFGWRDRLELDGEVNHSGSVTHEHTALTPEQHQQRIAQLEAEKRRLETTIEAEVIKETVHDHDDPGAD